MKRFLIQLTVLIVGVLLWAIFWAVAASHAATKDEIASFAAGKPVRVSCDVDRNNPLGDPRVLGWAYPASSEVHLRMDLCNNLLLGPGTGPSSAGFNIALLVLMHEARHAAGVMSESCANWYAIMISYDVLRRFWGVPFFTPTSLRTAKGMLGFAYSQPMAHWPAPC